MCGVFAAMCLTLSLPYDCLSAKFCDVVGMLLFPLPLSYVHICTSEGV
jgi:hypothetical protein